MKLTLRLSTFLVVLDSVSLRWDAGIHELWVEVDDLSPQDRGVIVGLLKGLDRNWTGMNDPSCPHSVDVTMENHVKRVTYPKFRIETNETLTGIWRKTLRFTGTYGHVETDAGLAASVNGDGLLDPAGQYACYKCKKVFAYVDLLDGSGGFLGWCIDCDQEVDNKTNIQNPQNG